MRKEARATILKLWQEFLDKKETSFEDVQTLLEAVNTDLTVRDYLLGFPLEIQGEMSAFSASAMCGEFISALSIIAKNNEVDDVRLVPFMSIIASYFIDLGQMDEAMNALRRSLEANPEYSYSKLLVRGVQSGMVTPEMFQSMRFECHPKVLAEME